MNEKIAEALIEADTVKFGEFSLTSDRKTHIYIDLKVLPSYPEIMETVTAELAKAVKKLKPDVIAGAESAGIPFAMAVAIKTKMPMVYVRKRPKNYGQKDFVEGIIKKGSKAVLMDDMVTNAFSKISLIEGLRNSGAEVKDVMVILDREQGGKEALEKEGVELHSLITLKELLGYMKDKNKINSVTFKQLIYQLDIDKGADK